jgi:hypothetical protein
MKQFVCIFFFTLHFLLIATSCNNQALPKSPAVSGTVNNSTTTISTSQTVSEGISKVVTSYYRAIEKQNYGLAYTYLDPTETKLSHAAFAQEALSQDTGGGRLQSYTIAIFPPMVVMTNMRVNIGPYHVHLQFKQERGVWKIVSLDGI